MSNDSRKQSAKREKLEAILEDMRRGAISSNEAAKQLAAAGASMAVIGRLLQPKAMVISQRHKNWNSDGWFG